MQISKYILKKHSYGEIPVNTINEQLIDQKALKRTLKNNYIHTLKANALSDLCMRPLPNEQYRIITEKQFNSYALILHLIESEIIEEMYLAIYRINKETVESLINFIETNYIKQSTFIISNFFNQTKKPEKWAIMLKEYADSKRNVNHAYVHNHSKILAVKTNLNNYYVFEGSGNMSDNARIEQYIYENSKMMFEFHKEWMLSLIKK